MFSAYVSVLYSLLSLHYDLSKPSLSVNMSGFDIVLVLLIPGANPAQSGGMLRNRDAPRGLNFVSLAQT